MRQESLSRKILRGVLLAGAIYCTASNPYFTLYLSRNLFRALRKKKYLKQIKNARNDKFDNAFYYLKRKGYIDVKKKRGQIYISLTKEGKKRARKYLIDDLEIKKPKVWDRNWRIVIFDIPNSTNIKRAALRGKLKELKFYKLQQSVWVHPYPCEKEIKFLQNFFGLQPKELYLITGKIRDDDFLKKKFKIR